MYKWLLTTINIGVDMRLPFDTKTMAPQLQHDIINLLNNSYRKISPKHYRHPKSIKIFQIARTIERRQWDRRKKGPTYFFLKKVWFFCKSVPSTTISAPPFSGKLFYNNGLEVCLFCPFILLVMGFVIKSGASMKLQINDSDYVRLLS